VAARRGGNQTETGKEFPMRSDATSGVLDRAHEAVDRGDIRFAKRLLKAAERESGIDKAELALVRWRVASLDENLDEALRIAREAAKEFGESADLQHALGWTLLELGQAEDAVAWLEEACYLDEGFADAWYDLALAREMLGDEAGMRQAFTEVWELDRIEPRPPLRFAENDVQGFAKRALDALPKEVRDAARDVPIFVEELPDGWILDGPPWDPRLLGLFDGPTWAEVQSGSHAGDVPHIYLFHRNLERVCADAREMAEQVRVTVHHEIGHFLGLDENDLDERGLG
jgi:predicted Zn-dependent protease with MMP-like domain